MQHKLQYNNGVAIQIMQHKSGGTVQSWQQNTISDIGKFLVYLDFLGILITLTQKINDYR